VQAATRALLWPVVAGAWLSIALLFIATTRALAPLSALTQATRRLAAGDLRSRVPETGAAELVELSTAFNSMAGRARHRRSAPAPDGERRGARVAHAAHEPALPDRGDAGWTLACRRGCRTRAPRRDAAARAAGRGSATALARRGRPAAARASRIRPARTG